MAFFDKFNKPWSSENPVQEVPDFQRAEGWDFLGPNPPLTGQFDAVQQETDQKVDYLFNLMNSFVQSQGGVLSQTSTNEFRDIMAEALSIVGSGHVGYTTLADMQADITQPDNTIGEVFGDPIPGNNGFYLFIGGSWVKQNDPRQDATTALALKVDGMAINFMFAPYANFYDNISFAETDINGIKIDADVLLDTVRNAGTTTGSPYLNFSDISPYDSVDKFGKLLTVKATLQSLWSQPIYVDFTAATKTLDVIWRHDRNMLFRIRWMPNGANGLFNHRGVWWSSTTETPENAVWNMVQEINTDHVPPVTNGATSGVTSPNVGTTGGNHLGKAPELLNTAYMTSCVFHLEDTLLMDFDYKGNAKSVTATWLNELCSGNTVTEQRITMHQDVKARFTARNVEILYRLTALEPLWLSRDGGTQMVTEGYLDAFHFYGGVQQGSIAGASTNQESGAKNLAPDCWANVAKSNTLGFMASWIDRSFGVKNDFINDPLAIATANGTKLYNFTIRNDNIVGTDILNMDAGDSYSWRGGYSWSPIDIVDGIDSAFVFRQGDRLRLAVANSSADLSGTVKLPDEFISSDFEIIGPVDSIGTPLTFTQYTAKSYKEEI